MILKTQRRYALPGGLTLEVNLVDEGQPGCFWYAEVEFETEAQALAWKPEGTLAAYLSDEVTGPARAEHGGLLGRYPAAGRAVTHNQSRGRAVFRRRSPGESREPDLWRPTSGAEGGRTAFLRQPGWC